MVLAFGYYGNHTVTVVGYNEYERDYGLYTQKKTFIKVYDGWTKQERYIDSSLINFGSFSTAQFD